ncbi:MAG: hypothetical protein AAGC76_09540 [Luteibacter sp.]|uniref:hypothetical protein n=1 Tax=Luteibacter sp. TaxID=1886636 RepID=UPI002809DC1B|nr:hypothetical protein [Luteibacter sp.]MDQ7996083.1 hypothetical protein [Luteibacter sp.]
MSNVTELPVKPRSVLSDPNATLELVQSYKCQHGNYQVDEKAAEVTCGRCKEKLNPIWVLMQIATDDRVLRDRWSSMRAEIELMKPRTQTKCKHCQKLTPVPTNVKSWDIQQRAAEIRRRTADGAKP